MKNLYRKIKKEKHKKRKLIQIVGKKNKFVVSTSPNYWENLRGEISEKSHKNENRAKHIRNDLQPKTLRHRFVGLVSCMLLNFLILTQCELRLTLGYLTISPSSESLSSILVHSSLVEAFSNTSTSLTKDPHLYRRFTHLKEICLLETSVRKRLSIQESNCTHMSRFLISFAGNENRAKHIREWHHLQPKTVRH